MTAEDSDPIDFAYTAIVRVANIASSLGAELSDRYAVVLERNFF